MVENKKLSPKLDVVFHMLFGQKENEKITKGLIEDIIQEKVETIELEQTPYLWGAQAEDKVGIIDVRAKINNNTHVDIEMQMLNQENIEKRILYYWSKLYSKQLKRGVSYHKLEKTICILFINENISKFKDLPIQTIWKIIETTERKNILTNDLELHIIEMMKKEKEETAGNLKKWISFFNNPNGEAVIEMAKEDEEIKEAVEKLEEISSDEAKIRIAELREKYILDQNTNIYGAEERGLAKGLAKGRVEGMAKGRAEGMAKGRAEGMAKGRAEVAKRMKEKDIAIEVIEEVTGLTKEKIEKL